MSLNEKVLVPFNQPSFLGNELVYISEAIKNGQISGDGAFTKKCSQFLETTLAVKRALLTTSCTDALEMSALLLNIQPGDEIIVPSFTFVSTVNAFVLRGAIPRFVDIKSETLNLDETLVERAINSKTKAIVPVHYAGVGCDMDNLVKISQSYNLSIVEDNAHGLFGKYKGQFLGTFGDLSTQSFHETKNFTCGEGGALLINNERFVERAEILREKGTNRKKFFQGIIDKYTWVDIGSSFLPSDILSAFLYAQFESWQYVQEKRQKIWHKYNLSLQEWARENQVGLPFIPNNCEQAYHMFYILCPNIQFRSKLISYLKQKGIYAVFHYLPLHLSEMGKKFGGQQGDCPVTEKRSDQLLRLPFFTSLSDQQLDLVISTILDFNPSSVAV